MGRSNILSDYTIDDIHCRTILDNLPRVIMLVNFNGGILYLNRGGEEICGYSAEEAENENIWSLYSDYSEEMFLEHKSELKNDESFSLELKALHKNGKTIWMDVRMRLIQMKDGNEVILVSGSDISDLLMTQKDKVLSENRMQAILDTAVEGIITIDTRGIVESFNKAAEEIFGYTEEEVVGENVKILMPSPYFEEHDHYISNYLETGEKKIIGIGREVRGKRKNGEVFPMELAVSEVQYEGNRIFTGIIRDISERRELENEILQIGEEERRKIGRELHDGLGQMLTGIGLIAQNLARKLKSNELPGSNEVQEISEMVREADEQARALAHGLVHMELEDEGFQVALDQLCERVKRLFKIDCKRDFDGDLEITNKVAALHLYRIVQEAISNAVKHGKASNVWVELEQVGDYVELKVVDDGIGFSNPVNRKKLKGIGMNTMHYRANLLGGYLDIRESSEGHTVLNCKIPKAEFKKS